MERVIPYLPVEAVRQLASYLEFDPLVDDGPGRTKLLSQLPEPQKLAWLDSHRSAIMEEISSVGGHSIANGFRGRGVSYAELVYDLAQELNVNCLSTEPVENIERKIVAKVWQNITAKMTPAQRKELEARAEEQARKLGRSITGELAGFG